MLGHCSHGLWWAMRDDQHSLFVFPANHAVSMVSLPLTRYCWKRYHNRDKRNIPSKYLDIKPKKQEFKRRVPRERRVLW